MDTVTRVPVTQIFEHEGLFWRPGPEATSTFEEFLHARAHWLEIWHEVDWNPWRKEELAPQLAHAEQVTSEWERAEPDFKPLTTRQWGARQGAITRRIRAERKANEAPWERAKASYDSERETERFALLEREAIQANMERDVKEYRAGTVYPAMPADRRAKEVTALDSKIEHNLADISRLSLIVGDREEVVDKEGRLPRDRRESNVVWYRHKRQRDVKELRVSTAAVHHALDGTKDQGEVSALRIRLSMEERRLSSLLAVPRLEAEQMCADCYTPWLQHIVGGDIYTSWPCRRWPMHAARLERAFEILRSAPAQNTPSEPMSPAPHPLATLPGNLPIAEVMERLSELHQEHPDAIVKRGRANRWELWSTP